MTAINTKTLYDYLLNEIVNHDLTKVDESLYENMTLYFKQRRNNTDNSNNIGGVLASEEKTLILSLVQKLLEIRLKKILLNGSERITLSNLTLEERFLFEIHKKFKISTDKLLKNIKMGNVNILSEMKTKVKKRAVLVRVQSDIPPFIGIDLKKYGPFEPEDVTILPNSNIEPFLNKISLSEDWEELS
jgi:DNA replication factor GINS